MTDWGSGEAGARDGGRKERSEEENLRRDVGGDATANEAEGGREGEC